MLHVTTLLLLTVFYTTYITLTLLTLNFTLLTLHFTLLTLHFFILNTTATRWLDCSTYTSVSTDTHSRLLPFQVSKRN